MRESSSAGTFAPLATSATVSARSRSALMAASSASAFSARSARSPSLPSFVLGLPVLALRILAVRRGRALRLLGGGYVLFGHEAPFLRRAECLFARAGIEKAAHGGGRI